MDLEEQFVQTLREAGESYNIEARPLIERSLRRGRARRTKRIAYTVSAGTAAVALACTGVALSMPSHPASVSASTSSSRSGPWIVDQLHKLVPPGRFSNEVSMGAGGGRPYTQPASAQVVYDDGHGAAHLALSITLGDGDSQPGSSCPLKRPASLLSCKESKLANGSTVMVAESALGSARHLRWTATLTTRNYDQIIFDEVNSTSEAQSSPVTRATPPLSAAQLSAIVSDSAWSQVLAGLRPTRPDGQPSQAQVIALAKQLQPTGFRFGSNTAENNEGEAEFPVTKDGEDGNSGTQLMVEVQHWPAGTYDEVRAQDFASATRLSDGTLLLVAHLPTSPVPLLQVSVLRPDGTVVRLAEPALGRGKDESSLVLPLAQLKAMAQNPLWTR